MSIYLDIPWEEAQYLKVKYRGTMRPRGGSIFMYSGTALPSDLKPFRASDFSYARWLEDDARGKESPVQISPTQFTPKPHQKEAAKKILTSYSAGRAGFLLADKTGIGKTLAALLAAATVAQKSGHNSKNKAKLLVVCPKSAIPVWRQTLQSYKISTNFLRVMVINYQQLEKLLSTPKKAAAAKKRRTKTTAKAKEGVPLIDFDLIIFDEAHALKNYPTSSTSRIAANIAKLNKPYVKGKSPFVIYSTATPGASPLNFAIMANWLAPLISSSDQAKKITPSTWGAFLEAQGFAVSKGKNGYNWATLPWYSKNATTPEERKKYENGVRAAKLKQRKDTKRIGQALKKANAPFIMRSPVDIEGWPEQQYVPLPLELSNSAMATYEKAWSVFSDWMRLNNSRNDPKGALVQQLRYRQKASLLKVDAMIDHVAEMVDAGNQVYISVQFMDTIDEYVKKLSAKKIKCVEISGRNVATREGERIKFQKGEAQVVLCTVIAAISLHAEESLPDGSKATSAPRITILHDVRENPLDTIQSAGRAHREGKNSLTYIPFIEKTVEEKVVNSFINKEANLKAMTGANDVQIEEIEKIFRTVINKK